MKKLLISIVFLPLVLQAQIDATILQGLCYENNKAHGFEEKSVEIDEGVFNLMTKYDFVGVNVIVSDKDEIQKLSDRISREVFGSKEGYGRNVDRKSLSILFGNRINVEQVTLSYSQEGSFHLLCHGFSDKSYNSVNRIILDGKEIDAKRAARIVLKELEGCDAITKFTKRPVVVVIHACGVGGKSRNSFASRLSRYLAKKSPIIYVVAAPGNIHPSVNSWPSYKEIVIDDNGIIVNWNCFHKGKFISEGEKDFATTIVKIQNKYLK